jgi:16S rRNA (uracil1498-N3)-methyltransferase
MSARFYVNCPLQVGPVALTGAEAHHLAGVCRSRPGDLVYLFNGDGRQYRAVVESADRRSVTLAVQAVESPQRELGFRLEVAVPLPRGDRGQFLVEKLTEVGVTCLVPLRTARSVVHPGESKQEKLVRWVKEASKQCGRNVLMAIAPLADWGEYIGRADLPARRWLAHPGGGLSWQTVPAAQDSALAIGPEGGFTEAEVQAAQAARWQQVDLGPRVLRVETAALALASICAVCGASSEK